MDIRSATQGDIPYLKQLWKQGFGDGDKFLDFYFTRYFNHTHVLVVRANGSLASSLYIAPVTLTHQGLDFKAAYIHGITTHPDYRNKGFARGLIEYAFEQLKNDGFEVCALIPANAALFDFYKKLGFASVFFISQEEARAHSFISPYSNEYKLKRFGGEFVKLFEFYTKTYRAADFSILKSMRDFLFFVNEFLEFEGDVFFAEYKNDIAACAFVSGKTIKELLFADEAARDFIVCEIFKITRKDELTIKTPVAKNSVNIKPFAMARILNIGVFLNAFGKEGLDLSGLSIGEITEFALLNGFEDKPRYYGYVNLMLNE